MRDFRHRTLYVECDISACWLAFSCCCRQTKLRKVLDLTDATPQNPLQGEINLPTSSQSLPKSPLFSPRVPGSSLPWGWAEAERSAINGKLMCIKKGGEMDNHLLLTPMLCSAGLNDVPAHSFSGHWAQDHCCTESNAMAAEYPVAI